MKYRKEVVEFIELKLESIDNEAEIAKITQKTFGLDRSIDTIRKKVNSIKQDVAARKHAKPIKRLFYDIETSYNTVRLWRTGKVNWVNADQIIEPKKIICISYKWWKDNQIHTLKWDRKQDDKEMINKFIKVLGEADEIVGHNGDRFDIKEIRTRAILQGELMFPRYRTFDTLKKARKFFNFESNKLDYLGKVLNVGRKLDHEGFQLWIDIVENKSKEKLDKMIAYCEQDVLLLEDVFTVLAPYVDHNTNFAVLKGKSKWHCPECASSLTRLSHTDTTPYGYVKRNMACENCNKQYTISNKSYMKYLEDNYHAGNN